jgi:hypothetical protein
MKRILKIVALVFVIVLVVGVCVIANGLFGHPISKALATNTAEKHLEENYANQDFEIERVFFNFKDGYYHAYIYSPNSMDSDFTIMIDMLGRMRYDTYGDRVISGWNTADRVSMEYRAAVDEVLNSPAFPYDEYIGFGEFDFYPRVHLEEYSVPEYALIIEDLLFDAIYDVNELGAKHGKLTIHIDDDSVSYENLAEILFDIRKTFDDAGVKFYVIDCVLEYLEREERVEVREFLYADIYEDGMVERVKASDEAAKAYYAEQNEEKLKETAVE